MNHLQKLFESLKPVTCVSVNSNSFGKLVSSSKFLIKLGEQFQVTLVPLFIPDFNLLSCELDNVAFNVLY